MVNQTFPIDQYHRHLSNVYWDTEKYASLFYLFLKNIERTSCYVHNDSQLENYLHPLTLGLVLDLLIRYLAVKQNNNWNFENACFYFLNIYGKFKATFEYNMENLFLISICNIVN